MFNLKGIFQKKSFQWKSMFTKNDIKTKLTEMTDHVIHFKKYSEKLITRLKKK